MAITYGNLGNIYSKKGDKSRMCDCWRKARDLYRVMGLADNAAEFEHWLKAKGCGDG